MRLENKHFDTAYRSEPLSDKQREVFEFLDQFITQNSYPPTRVEIAEHFSFSSPNAADEHLRALSRKGWIRLVPAISRGIVIRGAYSA